MEKIVTFLKEVKIELSKVSWPTRQQLVTYTATVVGMMFVLALFLGALDSGFAYIINILVTK
jgi:preprotein translocase subunit SecE